MALPAFVESLDTVAEAVRGEYTTTEGGFRLQVTPNNGWALEDVAGLKSTVSELKKRATAAEKQLRTFEGIDPEESKSAMTKLQKLEKEMENWDPDQKLEEHKKSYEEQIRTQYEGQSRREAEKHAAAVAELNGNISGLTKTLETETVKSSVMAACEKHGGNSKILLPLVRATSKLHDVGGKLKPVILDDEGEPRMSDEPGVDFMFIDEWVKKLSDDPDYGGAFPSSGSQGSGASGSPGGSPRAGSTVVEKINSGNKTPLERLTEAEAKGVSNIPVRR